MQRLQSGTERLSVNVPRSRQLSAASTRLKNSTSASAAFRQRGQRGPSTTTSKHHSQQHQQQAVTTILQRRERLRVYEDGEDVTPRTLVHQQYGTVEARKTAFDALGLTKLGSSQLGSFLQQSHTRRPSLATVSSFSSYYTIDEILAAGQADSFISSTRASLKGSLKALDVDEDDDDAPSQFHLPRFDSKEILGPYDKVTITLKETETFFLFEMPQLTEDARTSAGKAVIEANERYKRIMGGAGRKTVDAETQTPQLYTKTRGTFIGRQTRKNHSTFVNNWVMHDTYENEKLKGSNDDCEDSRFKFPDLKPADLQRTPEEQLIAIAEKDEYEDATRIALRILASKDYEEAQKKFAGLLVQDPCDPNLELIYGLDLLWCHVNGKSSKRSVSAFKWNPTNSSLLAVGYAAVYESHSDGETPNGLVLIWCAKNPTEPDRCYEFNSSISDLDWSRNRPNLLAIGFYDGIIRVIDVSKKQLTIVRETTRKTSPSFDPHWQVQWWPVNNERIVDSPPLEELYTSNQDGRVSYYPANEEFASKTIVHIKRIEGKILGVRRVNHCLGHEVPISSSPGVLVLRKHPDNPEMYLVGTEEGCVHKCSIAHLNSHLDSFLAHDGPIYSLEFSPFCSKLILTCGADWYARIWAEGLDEPLLQFNTKMACVSAAAWSPRNSTIFATAVGNEICIWDVRRKSHRPASITKLKSSTAKLQRLEFTRSGEQLVAADDEGCVYVYGIVGMPLPALDQSHTLVEAVQKALLTKPELLRRLKKLGYPFDK